VSNAGVAVSYLLKSVTFSQPFDLTKSYIGVPGLRGLDRCRRLYPHLHESNGFFAAKPQKQ
jgi:16S rRNA C967 or C1407 C5-methylase (RsmB/RsmF family)